MAGMKNRLTHGIPLALGALAMLCLGAVVEGSSEQENRYEIIVPATATIEPFQADTAWPSVRIEAVVVDRVTGETTIASLYGNRVNSVPDILRFTKAIAEGEMKAKLGSPKEGGD